MRLTCCILVIGSGFCSKLPYSEDWIICFLFSIRIRCTTSHLKRIAYIISKLKNLIWDYSNWVIQRQGCIKMGRISLAWVFQFPFSYWGFWRRLNLNVNKLNEVWIVSSCTLSSGQCWWNKVPTKLAFYIYFLHFVLLKILTLLSTFFPLRGKNQHGSVIWLYCIYDYTTQ